MTTRLDGMRIDGVLRSYTTVGCYPLYYLDGRDNTLCPNCANESDRDADNAPEDRPQAAGVNWESPDLHCDQCSGRIESAYGEVD